MNQISTGQSSDRLSLSTIVNYAYPVVGISFVNFLFLAYFLKFATDTLLVAPAIMGMIFAIARAWDAISDPVIGYLSDRTTSSYGRRRPWLFASVIPMAIVPMFIWSPPAGLTGVSLIIWLTVGVLLLETALTIFLIPHTALGAELSKGHHERTRIFAFRHAAMMAALFINALAIYLLTTTDDIRKVAFQLSLVGGVVAATMIFLSTLNLRENTQHFGRGAENPYHALRDVVRNKYAWPLLIVFMIENLGIAALALLTPYLLEYVVLQKEAVSFVLLCHIVPSVLIIPVAIKLTPFIGKKTMYAGAALFAGTAFLAVITVGEGELYFLLFCVFCSGLGLGITAVVGPSIQSDVIDYDEYLTGQRKEGAYFAVWNFIRKAAAGITAILVGIVLQWVGFIPNEPQTEEVQFAISALYAALPATCLFVGAALFLWKFGLTTEVHQRIRHELDSRFADRDSSRPLVHCL